MHILELNNEENGGEGTTGATEKKITKFNWFVYLLSIVQIQVHFEGENNHHHKNLDTILEKIYVQIQGHKRGSIYMDCCAVQTKLIIKDVNQSTG